MKNYILKLYAVALAMLGLGMAACVDLDLPSDGRLTRDEIFSEYSRVKNYYSQCYAYIPAIGFTYGDTPLASFSDEAHDASDGVGGPVYDWYNNRISASNNPLGSYWAPLFAGIFKCNTFLQSVGNPEITTATIDPVEKDGWMAEARVLRAFYYLQLIKRYGGVPILHAPYEVGHDFSNDRRATFEECVDSILADCDVALATPENASATTGFRWTTDSRTTFTRAVAYAIKSQAALYAASPLWSTTGSKYTWDKATEITKEALDACLDKGFKLFDIPPTTNIVQNSYEYYFITRADPSRAIDKETIYESAARSTVWSLAGLPVTTSAVKAGAGPSQELVDAYGMVTTGDMPITGYSDDDHLQPIINTTSGYDATKPYKGRDPRFYASIYYNGSIRELFSGATIDTAYPLTYRDPSADIVIDSIDSATFLVKCNANGSDPYFYFAPSAAGLRSRVGIPTLKFEYKSNRQSSTCEFFCFKDGANFKSTGQNITLPKQDDWTPFEYSLAAFWGAESGFNWGDDGEFLRMDPAASTVAAYEITIRNLRLEMLFQSESQPTAIATAVGGNCEISDKTTETKNTRTGYYLRKFNSYKSNAQINDEGSMKIFRLGELYLNFAEAAYQAKGADAKVGTLSALDAVNAIRTRAGMPELVSSTDFEVRYRNERQVELAFEEHRFFDVRRWKILDKTDGFVTGMKISITGTDTTYNRIKLKERGTNTDKYLRYPIPQSEVIKMGNYTGTDWQNLGW